MFTDEDQHLHWLAIARRYTPSGIDPADVLQEACLAAMRSRRTDLSSPPDQRYFRGIIRKTAWAMRRSDARRKRHELSRPVLVTGSNVSDRTAAPDLSHLPASLQAIANLVMADLDRNEIRSALGISDDAFRRRLADLRRYVETHSLNREEFESALLDRQESVPGDVGLIRQALVYWLKRRIDGPKGIGTVDPDGHLLAVSEKSSRSLTKPSPPAAEG